MTSSLLNFIPALIGPAFIVSVLAFNLLKRRNNRRALVNYASQHGLKFIDEETLNGFPYHVLDIVPSWTKPINGIAGERDGAGYFSFDFTMGFGKQTRQGTVVAIHRVSMPTSVALSGRSVVYERAGNWFVAVYKPNWLLPGTFSRTQMDEVWMKLITATQT